MFYKNRHSVRCGFIRFYYITKPVLRNEKKLLENEADVSLLAFSS